MKFRTFAAILFGLQLVACSEPPPPPEPPVQVSKIVSGNVTFRERIGLTAESKLEVSLLDISAQDAAATEIAAKSIERPGQSPLPFSLQFDASLINEQHSYSVSARVFDREQLIFVSDTVNPVLTHGAPDEVEVKVVRVSRDRSAMPDASLSGARWVTSTLFGEAVVPNPLAPPPYLEFNDTNNRVSGFAGCNRINGDYTRSGTRIDIGQVVATMRACPEGGNTEASFLQLLEAIDEFRIQGRTMRGYQAGVLVASFEAS